MEELCDQPGDTSLGGHAQGAPKHRYLTGPIVSERGICRAHQGAVMPLGPVSLPAGTTQLLSDERCHNLYGLAECSVQATNMQSLPLEEAGLSSHTVSLLASPSKSGGDKGSNPRVRNRAPAATKEPHKPAEGGTGVGSPANQRTHGRCRSCISAKAPGGASGQ